MLDQNCGMEACSCPGSSCKSLGRQRKNSQHGWAPEFWPWLQMQFFQCVSTRIQRERQHVAAFVRGDNSQSLAHTRNQKETAKAFLPLSESTPKKIHRFSSATCLQHLFPCRFRNLFVFITHRWPHQFLSLLFLTHFHDQFWFVGISEPWHVQQFQKVPHWHLLRRTNYPCSEYSEWQLRNFSVQTPRSGNI